MIKTLLIVESPSKAKQIQAKFENEITVVATAGHFCDLPSDEMGFDFHTFKAKYVLDPSKRKIISHIKKLSQSHDVYLGPDLDREGESIAAHLARELKLKNPKRVTYQEVTKEKIKKALDNPKEINWNLVEAQEARRVVDRMIGYMISPMIGVIHRNSSAGRVQTAGLLILIDRHLEIINFTPEPYITISCQHHIDDIPFISRYVHKGEGLLNDDKLTTTIVNDINEYPFLRLINKEEQIVETKAPCPFTTSLMQQAASNKFGWPAEKTMKLAQKLFESGHITYHRTDSKHLAEEFCITIRKYLLLIERKFNVSDLIPKTINKFTSKAGAQEAHEAIRPTDLSKDPKEFGDEELINLYALIKTRTIASQASNAISLQTSLTLEHEKKHQFIAKGLNQIYKGWRLIATDDAEEIDQGESGALPNLVEHSVIDVNSVISQNKLTTPKPYFTEATFIKQLEVKGVGRPSTYANIIKTVESRNFIYRERKKLIPTEKGIECGLWLRANFAAMDVMYTAKLEKVLDEITCGNINYPKVAFKVFNRLKDEISILANKIGIELCENGLPQTGNKKDISNRELCPSCKKISIETYPTRKDKDTVLKTCKSKGCKEPNKLLNLLTNKVVELKK